MGLEWVWGLLQPGFVRWAPLLHNTTLTTASYWTCRSVWQQSVALFDELRKQKLTSCARGDTICPRPTPSSVGATRLTPPRRPQHSSTFPRWPLQLPDDLDLCPFDPESGVQVTCDVGYLSTNFGFPRPLSSRLRPDVRDSQTSDRIIA